MAEKYYLDTSIWMDYYEDRKDSSKNIGEFAFKFLCKLLASKSIIVVSSFVQRELEANYSLDKIRSMTTPFEKLMERIEISDEAIEEAKEISKSRNLPFGDALHAVLARNSKAIMITRDNHFQLLKDICEVMKPEDLI